jgi:hypothetical protein
MDWTWSEKLKVRKCFAFEEILGKTSKVFEKMEM